MIPPGRMPFVAVDVGNSGVRLVVAAESGGNRGLRSTFRMRWNLRGTAEGEISGLAEFLASYPGIGGWPWYVATVQRERSAWLRSQVTYLCQLREWRELTRTDLTMPVAVDFPDKVGIDRLLAGFAIFGKLNPGEAAVVVDAGTAITVDLVSRRRGFEGGAIVPGAELQFAALASGTAALPLVSAVYRAIAPETVMEAATGTAKLLGTQTESQAPALPGKSTETAIRGGVYWGSIGAIRAIAERLWGQEGDTCRGYLTGGWGAVIADDLSDRFEYRQDLVLRGIERVVDAI